MQQRLVSLQKWNILLHKKGRSFPSELSHNYEVGEILSSKVIPWETIHKSEFADAL